MVVVLYKENAQSLVIVLRRSLVWMRIIYRNCIHGMLVEGSLAAGPVWQIQLKQVPHLLQLRLVL